MGRPRRPAHVGVVSGNRTPSGQIPIVVSGNNGKPGQGSGFCRAAGFYAYRHARRVETTSQATARAISVTIASPTPIGVAGDYLGHRPPQSGVTETLHQGIGNVEVALPAGFRIDV